MTSLLIIVMECGHQVHKDYPQIKCILDKGHGGMHGYDIKGNIHYIGGCCPDKTVGLLL